MCKRNYALSTLISPPPIGKYKFEASNIPHFLLACLLPGVFQAACKCTCIYSVERNVDDNHSRDYIMENSITSEPLTKGSRNIY